MELNKMTKYKCECKKAKCEVEREDTFYPQFCTCFCTKEADWQEVKEEEKAEEIFNFPNWCKVGKIVYNPTTKEYGTLTIVDVTRGIWIENQGNMILVNFYDLLEARLRPFNEKEMRELVGKAITYKTSEEVFLVTYFNKVHVGLGHLCLTAEDLLNKYTKVNGSPCGVYEHLENGEWVE
jgi:hypothetical protein